jgi:hypothetical protein
VLAFLDGFTERYDFAAIGFLEPREGNPVITEEGDQVIHPHESLAPELSAGAGGKNALRVVLSGEDLDVPHESRFPTHIFNETHQTVSQEVCCADSSGAIFLR